MLQCRIVILFTLFAITDSIPNHRALCFTYRPIIFVVYLKQEEENAFLSSLTNTSYASLCDKRIRLFLYIAKPESKHYDNFPINILRNVGIFHVQTSHFVVLDIDMWLSGMLFFPIFIHSFHFTY